MFRAQQNVFDDAVGKATDENLTSENWEFIMDVCDRANANDSGPKDVVAALIKRLAHRNANVQLYTLELANALSQNCGVKVHRELASRSFTDAMLRLANDRNTHQQVKAKILERMQEWTTMFTNDRDLGIMEQAYMRLKNQHPNLHPPSKPVKQQITEADRQKEDDELQMALELSVKTQQQPPVGQSTTQGYAPNSGEASTQPQPSQALPSGTTAATVSRVRALFDFQPSEPGELQFKKGDIIAVLESVYKDWWKGSLRGHTGIFPLNYVEKLSDPTQEELSREAQMEGEVFAEIKNVEKLLTLLSTSNADTNVRDNEEITTLYHSTLAIRPKLIELIGKYSQRKDDFTQLNEKFIKARRDYEALLEASMSQPPPQHAGYGRPSNYNYPPAGYPPQQQPTPQPHDASRYYTQTPQDSRQNIPQHTPSNGPQPFYMAGQAPPIQTHSTAYMPSDPRTESPAVMAPPASLYAGQQPGAQPSAGQGRPMSHYEQQHPHELGTSSYASPPMDGGGGRRQSYPPQFQPQGQPQQQGSVDYSPSVYTPDDPYAAMPPHQQQQQQQQQQPAGHNPYPAPLNFKPPPPGAGAGAGAGFDPSSPYAQHPHQNHQGPPSQPPPAPPGAVGPASPTHHGNTPYPNLAAGQQPQQPPAQYQAYQPPRQDQYGSPGPGPGAAGGAGNPSDFYR